jgi:hypothetical protein
MNWGRGLLGLAGMGYLRNLYKALRTSFGAVRYCSARRGSLRLSCDLLLGIAILPLCLASMDARDKTHH